jgi:hypothetical protein
MNMIFIFIFLRYAQGSGFFKKKAPREKEVKKPGGQADDTVDEKQ